MGTTILALLVGVVIPYVARSIDARLHKEKVVSRPRLTGNIIATVMVWLSLYGLNMTSTVYKDHRSLVETNASLKARLSSQTEELTRLKAALQQDEDKIRAQSVSEPADSLRRRTVRAVYEWRAYLVKRAEIQPSFAAPNSSDPNPSEETKKAIQTWRKYAQDTQEYYDKHFKDRMLGILKEYESKGVPTRYLDNNFRQFVPGLVPTGSGWEDSPMDVLSQFRDLAYRVDAKDHLVTF
jgi:hypothetical protein